VIESQRDRYSSSIFKNTVIACDVGGTNINEAWHKFLNVMRNHIGGVRTFLYLTIWLLIYMAKWNTKQLGLSFAIRASHSFLPFRAYTVPAVPNTADFLMGFQRKRHACRSWSPEERERLTKALHDITTDQPAETNPYHWIATRYFDGRRDARQVKAAIRKMVVRSRL